MLNNLRGVRQTGEVWDEILQSFDEKEEGQSPKKETGLTPSVVEHLEQRSESRKDDETAKTEFQKKQELVAMVDQVLLLLDIKDSN